MPTGIFFNFLSICIFSRPNLNKTNMGFLFILMTVFNSLSILNFILVTKSELILGYTVRFPICGLDNFIRRTLFSMCSWAEVLISLDRVLSVYYPCQSKFFHKKSFHAFLIAIFLCVFCALNSTNLVSTPVQVDQNNSTIQACKTTSAITFASTVISLVMRIYLPLACIFLLNALIIRKLRKSKIKFFSNNNRLTKAHLKEHRFTVLTMLYGLVFWVFYIPVSCYLTANAVNFIYAFINESNSTLFSFIYDATQTIALSYHGLVFFMNIIFNKIFRKELTSIFYRKSGHVVSSDHRDVFNSSKRIAS